MSEDRIYDGEVIWFNVKLNYGFISWKKDGVSQTDMFCHYSDINMPGFKVLKAGQKVQFSIGKNNSGTPKAINVTILKSE